MIYDLHFHFRIEKEADMGTDNETGKPCEIYSEIILNDCDTPERDLVREEETHQNMVYYLADMLHIKPEWVVPITEKEYKESTAGEGELAKFEWTTDEN